MLETDIKKRCSSQVFRLYTCAETIKGRGAKRTYAQSRLSVLQRNAVGSIYTYDLTTEAVFSCDHFKPAPMNEIVIAKMVAEGDDQDHL